MEHHFNVEDAKKYGIEKAVLLNNLRFWLERNRANQKNAYQHEDGNTYYWTFNSSSALAILFPYLNERSIRRYLQELEDDGVIISGCFNKNSYDRTKWYSMPEFMATGHNIDQSIGENNRSIGQIGRPIPDNKTHIISDERTSLRESSSFEDEDDYSVEEVDEDGNPITAKKKKGGSKPKNKTAWNLIHYFQDLCRENLHAVPVSGAKEYTMVLRAMEKIGEDHVRGLITEWFSEGYEREVTIQLSRALSNVNLNKYIVNHGI